MENGMYKKKGVCDSCVSSKSRSNHSPKRSMMEPQPHHLLMDWNKANDLLTQEHAAFLNDPHHLMLDPPPETLIHLDEDEEYDEDMDAMKEMQYMIAVMQPVDIDPATVPKPNRRNVRISDDPQTVVARRRRGKDQREDPNSQEDRAWWCEDGHSFHARRSHTLHQVLETAGEDSSASLSDWSSYG